MPNPKNWLIAGRRIYTLLPGLVFLFGLMLTWVEVSSMRLQETNNNLSEFKIRANELAASLERRLTFNAEVLQGAAGLFSGSNDVSREEFRRYVQQLKLSIYNPGIQAIGYSLLIPAGKKQQHINEIRAEGFSDYTIWPTEQRDTYSAIVFVEPLSPTNRAVMGYDLQSEAVKKNAAYQARDTATAVMTEKITLLQDKNELPQPGFIIYCPVYKMDMPITTVEQRRHALVGWVYVALRITDLLSYFLQHEYPDFSQKIAISLYTATPPNHPELILSTLPSEHSHFLADEMIRSSSILGTDWQFHINPLPTYWTKVKSEQSSNVIMGAGIILSLAFAFLSYILSSTHLRVATALHKAEKANHTLAEQEALLRAVYDTSSVAVLLISSNGKILYSNQRVAELFHHPYQTLLHSDFYQLITESQQHEFHAAVDKVLRNESDAFSLEQRYQQSDGTAFIGLSNGQPFLDKSGKITGIVIVIEDITERRANEAAMQLASTVLEASPGGIMVTDSRKRIIAVNPAFSRITGYSAEEIINQSPGMLSSGQHDDAFYKAMWETIDQYGHWEGELINRRKDGQLLPELLSISRVRDKKGNIVNYVGMFLDITERWEAETRIQYLANHDYLTGLPNRMLLVERAGLALTLARRYRRRMAILFIDLDRFKPINDEYGHNVGDHVLKIIAQRLLDIVRESDTVCRQGGDEFVILLPEFTDLDNLEMLAIKLLDEIREPIQVNSYTLSVSASIGIATYPDNGDSVDSIIQSADTAMYRAKADTEKHICFARYLSAMRVNGETAG